TPGPPRRSPTRNASRSRRTRPASSSWSTWRSPEPRNLADRLLRPGSVALGRGDALLEGGHQLLDRRPARRGRLTLGAPRRRSIREHAEELLSVRVGVPAGIPLRPQGLDERDREVQLALVDLDVVQAGSELGRISDLVAEEHRLDGQDLLHRSDRDE